jgi:hypothetical protein
MFRKLKCQLPGEPFVARNNLAAARQLSNTDQKHKWSLVITYRGLNLTFIGPCIVIYSYSTTNRMHLFLKLFILVKHATCFGRSFRPSSGAQDCTYSNRHMSKQLLLPAASEDEMESVYVWHMPVAVSTVLNSWWWTGRPSETCRVFYKNK